MKSVTVVNGDLVQHGHITMRMLNNRRCNRTRGSCGSRTGRAGGKTCHLWILLIFDNRFRGLLLLVGSEWIAIGQQLWKEGETFAIRIDARYHLGHFFTGQAILYNLIHTFTCQIGPMLRWVEEATFNYAIIRDWTFKYFCCGQIFECLFLRIIVVCCYCQLLLMMVKKNDKNKYKINPLTTWK